MKYSCKDCTERHIGCHSTCETYKAFRAELEEKSHEQKKKTEMNQFVRDIKSHLVRRQEHKGIRADRGKLR